MSRLCDGSCRRRPRRLKEPPAQPRPPSASRSPVCSCACPRPSPSWVPRNLCPLGDQDHSASVSRLTQAPHLWPGGRGQGRLWPGAAAAACRARGWSGTGASWLWQRGQQAARLWGASRVPALSTSLPRRPPPLTWGQRWGRGPAEWRCVCLQREGALPGLGPCHHKGSFACRSNQSHSWNSGSLGWVGWLPQGLEPRQT